MKSITRDAWIAAGVGLCAGLLHFPTVTFGFSGLDDHSLILQRLDELANPTSLVSAFRRAYDSAPHCLYYRPLVTVSFAINAMVTGSSPAGYHATNVALHVLASMLVYALLRRTVKEVRPALLGALLFAISPINTEAVAWIPGRNDLLLSCFTLGGLLSLPSSTEKFSRARIGVHLLCFAGALFTKETAICLPLVFFLASRASREPLATRIQACLCGAWIMTLGVYLGARSLVLSPPDGYLTALTHAAIHNSPVLLAEIGKLAFPWRLQVIASPEELSLWPGVIALTGIACIISLVPSWRSRRMGYIGALTLCPLAMNLLATQNVVLESRLYLPMVGTVAHIAEVLRIVEEKRPRRAPLVTVLVVVVASLLSLQAYRYSLNFENPRRFARAAFAAAPRSAVARSLLFRVAHPESGGSAGLRPNREGH